MSDLGSVHEQSSKSEDPSEDPITINPTLAGRVVGSLHLLANDVRVVRRIHYVFALAAAVPVGILLWLLWAMVSAFSLHIAGANTFLLKVVEAKPITTIAKTATVASPPVLEMRKIALKVKKADETKDGKDSTADVTKAKDEDLPTLSDQAHLFKMISSYQTSLSTSSVAVISILVIAVVVISVAILRSALALEPYDPSKRSDEEKKSNPSGSGKDDGYAIPLYEFGKRLKELFAPFFEKK